jgi:hypothetical protein
MKYLPVNFIWSPGDLTMRCDPRYAEVARRQFHEQEVYPLVPLEARSRESHNAFFAAIHDGWQNLPEKLQPRFPTPEHLRKWCLIETDWCDEEEYRFGTRKNAAAAAVAVRKREPHARILVPGQERTDPETGELYWPLIVRTAKSQSAAAMAKQPFEDSKRDVIDLIEHMIGVPAGTLLKRKYRPVKVGKRRAA